MKGQPTLARHLESFFHQRLTDQRNATPATITAYRDALRLLILFVSEHTNKKPCDLDVCDLERDVVLAFLDHLECSRGNSIQTRNARLTAIRSFFHHVAANDPAAIGTAQRILAIPSKKTDVLTAQYLSKTELDALVGAPNEDSSLGRRDRALLTFLARTGARVSEALGVEVADLTLDGARSQVLLHGKGRKQRMVPLAHDVVTVIENLIKERGVSCHESAPLFVGRHGQRLTRFGATHVVRRAVSAASREMPDITRKRISPHIFRHSFAMILLQSGVDLLTIQAWLGHSQVATTHRYAAADVEMMRHSLDQASIQSDEMRHYKIEDPVLSLLKNL